MAKIVHSGSQRLPKKLRVFVASLPHNIRVFSITDLFGNFARSMVMPYVSLYILALGGNTAQIGLIQSLTPLFGLLMFPIGGYLGDKTSRVRMIVVSNSMLIINVLIMAFAPNWQVYAIATALQGLAYFQFPARSALLADSLLPSQRGKGIATMNTVSNTFAIMAPFIAGSIITIYGDLRGMRMLLVAMAILYGTSTLIIARFLRDTVDLKKRSNGTTKRGGLRISAILRVLYETYGTIPSTLRELPGSLKALAGVIVLSFMANGVASPFWVVYATEEVGLSSAVWGLVLLIETVLRIVMFVPAGMLVDRWGRTQTLFVALSLSLISIPSFILVTGFTSALIVRCAVAVSFALALPSCTALMADSIPRSMRGRVMSALGQGGIMIGPAGGGTSGPAVGYLVTIPLILSSILGGILYTINPVLPWMFVGATTILSVGLIVLFIRDPEQAEV